MDILLGALAGILLGCLVVLVIAIGLSPPH
jgi:hypothetical protein